MTGKDPQQEPGEVTLEAREQAVLRSVIRQHVLSGEPISSRTVSRGARLDLSPASIRNVMSELEAHGYLVQPHISAGRVPTDKAYRLYVDQMLMKTRVGASQAQAIEEAMARSRSEIPDLLAEASRQLSLFSSQVGIVLAPELRRIVVEHVEFVRLEGRRVVAILVGRSGVVHNRILEVDEAIDQNELDRIGRYLSAEFCGRTLPQMRNLLQTRMSEERARYDDLMAQGLELGSKAVADERDNEDGEIFVEGASNLLGSPEFADLEVVRGLFKTLEEKKRLIGILTRVIDGEGVQVVIGEESRVSDLSRCSLVASNYRSGERVMGTIGIVGPTRMAYARAIALVDFLANLLTRLLSQPGN